MSKNRILSEKTAHDIDRRVERVLKGLGNPEPPLRLEDVRHLLKLDKAFYTASNPSAVQEKISRIRVATIQVYERPALLWDAIKKLSLKALYLPDRRRILLDGDLPEKKHRWNEAHEIGHSLIPWHEDVMHGDNNHTLLPHCHEEVEAEANFAGGRLLFLQDRFTEEALSSSATISIIKELHGKFGNTLSTTLYRFVEVAGTDRPLVGMITGHPHKSKRKADFDALNPAKYFIQSPMFAERFSKMSERDVFNAVAGYCGAQRGGILGESDLILTDDNGDDHRFHFETFYNTHDALTLGVYRGLEARIIAA
jgi:Zn-dependent peptidase ImmA (M78 family)